MRHRQATIKDRDMFLEFVNYNKTTGFFTCKKRTSHRSCRRVGDIVGSKDTNGYISITVNRVRIKAHRLAHLMVKGYLPEEGIDHVFGDKNDNRWIKIREATASCQQRNMPVSTRNTSGFRGVRRKDKYGLYEAQVWYKNKSIYLGKHSDIVDAALARITWEDWCCNWTCGERDNNRIKLRELGYNV